MNDSLEEMTKNAVDAMRFHAAFTQEPFGEEELDFLYESFLETRQHLPSDPVQNLSQNKIRERDFIDLFQSNVLELENLQPEDLDITDTRFIGFQSLEQLDFGREEIFTLLGTTVEYLNQMGVEVDEPEKLSFEPGYKSNPTDSFYDFQTDRIHLLVDEDLCERSIPAMIGNEMMHKANQELLVQDSEKVRESIPTYKSVSGYQKAILENELINIPPCYKDLFGGLLVSNVQPQIEEMEDATEIIKIRDTRFGVEIGYSPIRDKFDLKLYEEREYDSFEEFDYLQANFSDEDLDQVDSRIEKFVDNDEIGVELQNEIKSRFFEIKGRSDYLTENLSEMAEEYPFEIFEVRDEAMTWLTYFWIDRGFPDTSNKVDCRDLNDVRKYYNSNNSYSDSAGDLIADEIIRISNNASLALNSPEKSFNELLKDENRENYLISGELPY